MFRQVKFEESAAAHGDTFPGMPYLIEKIDQVHTIIVLGAVAFGDVPSANRPYGQNARLIVRH